MLLRTSEFPGEGKRCGWRSIWSRDRSGGGGGLLGGSFMKSLLGPLLVAQLVREGLWYAGSRGNRQEMFVIRGFPSHELPSFPDPAAGGGHRELWRPRLQEPAFGTAAGRAAFAGAPGV